MESVISMFDYFGLNISDSLHKICCRIILHRYFGKYLDRNLSLDQLSFQFSKGSIQIADFSLSVHSVNDLLKTGNIPLKLVDGYVGNLTLDVPWKNLISQPTKVKINQLQLTFQPTDTIKLDDKDLVSSMIESVVSTLSNSGEFAKSIYNEACQETSEDLNSEDSVAAFTKVVDAISSRFCIEIHDTTIRFENRSSDSEDTNSAIEITIDKISFMDEQMKTIYQENVSTNLVLTQPHGIGNITNLNKFLIVQGVNMYTDVFTKVTDGPADDEGQNTLITSMHIRREKQKQEHLTPTQSPNTSIHPDLYKSAMSEAATFHSCYQDLSLDDSEEQATTSEADYEEPALCKFAELVGEATVIARVKNEVDNKIELEHHIKGINVFISPSQIAILQKFFTSVTLSSASSIYENGRPMEQEDHEAVVKKIEQLTTVPPPLKSLGGLIGGNWNQADRNDDFQNFDTITFEDKSLKRNNDQNKDSFRTLPSNQSDEMLIKGSLGSLLIFITHHDYLSIENVPIRSAAKEAMQQLQEDSKKFFDKARELVITAQTTLPSIRRDCAKLYPKDHLRIVGSNVSAMYRLRKDLSRESMYVKIALTNCDILEFLTQKSAPSYYEDHHFPLFDFNTVENMDNEPNLKLVISRSEEVKNQIKTELFMGPCKTELDLSIMDRISHLINTKPYFEEALSCQPKKNQPAPLKEDLYGNFLEEEEKQTSVLILRCNHWVVDLKVPKADLRDPRQARLSHRQRHIHDEFVQLTFFDASITIPEGVDDVSMVEIACSQLFGDFWSSTGEFETERFLSGATNGQKAVKIKILFNQIKKILIEDPSNSLPDMTKSFSAHVLRAQTRQEGPFSKTTRAFCSQERDEKIIQAGTREEMLTFLDSCIGSSSLSLLFDIPTLKIHVPKKPMLEVLYNRLVNDLALWQPAAPQMIATEEEVKLTALDTFQECPGQRNETFENNFNDDYDEEQMRDKDEYDRSVPHRFTFSLNAQKAVMLCNVDVKENGLKTNDGQVCIDLQSANVGTTYGYHGDTDHCFFHFTAGKAQVGSSNDPLHHITSTIEKDDFGRFTKDQTQVEWISPKDELSNGSEEDAIGVALHMHSRSEINVKDMLLSISLRNSLIYARPFRDAGHLWVTQISELFTLMDYDIPGYELPVVSTDLHFNTDNVILGYEHSWIKPNDKTSLRAVLGQINISCTVLQELNVNKTMCIFENSCLYINREPSKVSFSDTKRRERTYVPVLDLGLIELEILFAVIPPDATEDYDPKGPLYQIKCRNDVIKMWVCSDSLSKLMQLGIDISQSDKIKPIVVPEDKKDEPNLNSIVEESDTWNTSIPNMQKNVSTNELSELAEKRMRDLIEDATKEIIYDTTPKGQDAVDEFRSTNNFDASEDLGETENWKHSFNTDEEFCLVDEDILGSGITNAPNKPRVRGFGLKDNELPDIDLDLTHFVVPDEWRADGMINRSGNIPLIKYMVKDISIEICVFAGTDLSSDYQPKNYSRPEFRQGRGKNQFMDRNSYGGPCRDHSVSVAFEFKKINYMRYYYNKNSPFLSTTLFSVGDIIIHDRVFASDIKEMLYQYSNTGAPRRSLAPLLSVRMSTTHSNEGKMRVSMLPIKLNVDQDTLIFLTDFFDEVKERVVFPKSAGGIVPQPRPLIEVPAELNRAETPKKKQSTLYPPLDRHQILTPSPITDPFGDLSYFEKPGSNQSSPSKQPLRLDPLMSDSQCYLNQPADADSSFEYGSSSTSPDLRPELETSRIGDWKSDITNPTPLIADLPLPRASVDDLLFNSTMMGSIHPAVANLVDTNSDIEECTDDEGDKEDEEKQCYREDKETVGKPSSRKTSAGMLFGDIGQEFEQEGETFFKEFVFAPEALIYVDYQGKSKIETEKAGAVLGFFMAFGQLNKMPITLRELHCKKGMLGMGRCFHFAMGQWTNDMMTAMPSVIACCGPMSPFIQIGKGFLDLFLLPVEEMRRQDGHVVRGIQRGIGSFGTSSAAGIVGMAQTVVGSVQTFAELLMSEVQPDVVAQRNRRRVANAKPTDIRHALQLSLNALNENYKQTRDNIDLIANEDRTAGTSVVRSAFRYAVPTFLGQFVMASQITYQLLGGLRNQMRPDIYQDEKRKWGDTDIPGGSHPI